MRQDDRLSLGGMVGWGTLGLITGVAAGVGLSAWTGDVNRGRLRRAARRLREPAPSAPESASAAGRAAMAALHDHAELRALGIEARGVAPSVVELRGWVPSRLTRALAGRTVRNAPGIRSVINNVLVRGEDDRPIGSDRHPSDQSA